MAFLSFSVTYKEPIKEISTGVNTVPSSYLNTTLTAQQVPNVKSCSDIITNRFIINYFIYNIQAICTIAAVSFVYSRYSIKEGRFQFNGSLIQRHSVWFGSC